nr:MAG TPA: hypothetical protein [Caudoviricetes sp.]
MFPFIKRTSALLITLLYTRKFESQALFAPREHFFTINLITKYYKMLQIPSPFCPGKPPHPPPFARASQGVLHSRKM